MSSRQLYLFRHAKSSWDEPRPDHGRPLAPRGRRAAPAMAEHMKARDLVPDRVLCSTAARTRETWALMAPILGPDLPVSYHDEIYDEGPEGVLDLIRERGDEAAALMVVGHNPTMERLAAGLGGRGDPDLHDRLARKYPTAALAVLSFDASDWSALDWDTGELVRFVRPKDLPRAEERGL